MRAIAAGLTTLPPAPSSGCSPYPGETQPVLQHALTHIAVNYDPKKRQAHFHKWINEQIQLGNDRVKSLLNDHHEAIPIDKAYGMHDVSSHLNFGFGKLGDLVSHDSSNPDHAAFNFDDFFKTHDGEEDGSGENVDQVLNRMLGPKGWGIQDQRMLRLATSQKSSSWSSSWSSSSKSSWSSSSKSSDNSETKECTESSQQEAASFASVFLNMGSQFGAR
ncbi:uncharacterized protein PFL1_03358 [Pseudozyma flocculosa PF-1]|uniref:Uncharacterized protein n=1 Tax=Pseudozyma flocculosa PF-1 TaxID=1277687 RepID=A0A061H9F6_9BASI|nr:uncharacterized protein PFL1_03358 [Pseudozyma flocculosa PF-1]EPQ29069.1 hypothetical protein PFL1_03358 [Pseudozyma flocculosa PF-1]